MVFINIYFGWENFRIKPRICRWADETIFEWLFFQVGIDWYK